MADAADKAPALETEAAGPVHEPPSLETRLTWIEDWMTTTAEDRKLQARD